ncbi:MAG: hypothetical protein V1913_18335 [Fibrobacterota bacterium]
MKKLLLRILLLCALIYVASLPLAFLIDRGLRKSGYSPNYREWNDIYDGRIQADLLIQGSSRAWLHFDPRLLDSALGLQTYNLGLDGFDFTLQYGRYQVYRAHNRKPAVIVQTLDYLTFRKPRDLYMLEQFIPYLSDPLLSNAISEYRGLDVRDRHIPLFKYLRRRNMALLGLRSLRIETTIDNGRYKGFQSVHRVWDTAAVNVTTTYPPGFRFEIDSVSVLRFRSFLDTCRQEKIRVVLVYAPEFSEAGPRVANRDSVFTRYRELARDYGCEFIDYSRDPLCADTALFYNTQHLNDRGAAIFSRKLADDLQRYFSTIHR